MSNKELITCDYAGCSKPFAYRNNGFNLCAEHLFEKSAPFWQQFGRAVLRRRKGLVG